MNKRTIHNEKLKIQDMLMLVHCKAEDRLFEKLREGFIGFDDPKNLKDLTRQYISASLDIYASLNKDDLSFEKDMHHIIDAINYLCFIYYQLHIEIGDTD
jgi:hypothetical protein